MTKPTIIIVGSDKGGTGKTTTCRVLLDYLGARGVPVRAFDGQAPGGDLIRFAPDARMVDLTKVYDQMAVFDGVSADAVTVVDLPAGMLSPTITLLDEARLLDDVKSGAVQLILLHVLGPSVASISEIGSVARALGDGVTHLLVKNHINDAGYFDWDTEANKDILARMDGVTIKIGKLEPMACEMLQKQGGSFVSFIGNDKSKILTGKVSRWVKNSWAEFERVKLLN